MGGSRRLVQPAKNTPGDVEHMAPVFLGVIRPLLECQRIEDQLQAKHKTGFTRDWDRERTPEEVNRLAKQALGFVPSRPALKGRNLDEPPAPSIVRWGPG